MPKKTSSHKLFDHNVAKMDINSCKNHILNLNICLEIMGVWPVRVGGRLIHPSP